MLRSILKSVYPKPVGEKDYLEICFVKSIYCVIILQFYYKGTKIMEKLCHIKT